VSVRLNINHQDQPWSCPLCPLCVYVTVWSRQQMQRRSPARSGLAQSCLAWPDLVWFRSCLSWPGCSPLPSIMPYQASPPPLLLSFRIWAHAESPLHQNCRRNLVVFHAHHHLLLHGKLSGLPHRGEDGVAHRLCWRPCQADEDRIRGNRGWLHNDLLQG